MAQIPLDRSYLGSSNSVQKDKRRERDACRFSPFVVVVVEGMTSEHFLFSGVFRLSQLFDEEKRKKSRKRALFRFLTLLWSRAPLRRLALSGKRNVTPATPAAPRKSDGRLRGLALPPAAGWLAARRRRLRRRIAFGSSPLALAAQLQPPLPCPALLAAPCSSSAAGSRSARRRVDSSPQQPRRHRIAVARRRPTIAAGRRQRPPSPRLRPRPHLRPQLRPHLRHDAAGRRAEPRGHADVQGEAGHRETGE